MVSVDVGVAAITDCKGAVVGSGTVVLWAIQDLKTHYARTLQAAIDQAGMPWRVQVYETADVMEQRCNTRAYPLILVHMNVGATSIQAAVRAGKPAEPSGKTGADNAIELIEYIRAETRNRDTPIIATAGLELAREPDLEARAMGAGATEFVSLLEPRIRPLYEAIERYLK